MTLLRGCPTLSIDEFLGLAQGVFECFSASIINQ
jgi:hypothetical protein